MSYFEEVPGASWLYVHRYDNEDGFDIKTHLHEKAITVAHSDVPAFFAWLRKTYPERFADRETTYEGVLNEVRRVLETPETADIVEHARQVYEEAVAWRDRFSLPEHKTPVDESSLSHDERMKRAAWRDLHANVNGIYGWTDLCFWREGELKDAVRFLLRGMSADELSAILDRRPYASQSSAVKIPDAAPTLSYNLELLGLDDIKRDSAEVAENLERAAAAMQRIRGER